MIEWVLLALVGAGALSGIRKNDSGDDRTQSTTSVGSYAEARTLSEEEFCQNISAWREQWEPSIDRARWIPSGTAERILTEFPAPDRPRSWLDQILNRHSLLEELKAEFETHNQYHFAKQTERLKLFFDTVEKNPLTEEQIRACVCMDQCVQIVAAAGSGKTSTMVAKTGYALLEGLATAHEILLLAFNADAAQQLSVRVKDRLSNFEGVHEITAKTFHAFGLDVIASATGQKPSLAPWLENPGQDIEMIMTIINELSQRDPHFAHDWNIFRTIFGRDLGLWNMPAQPDAYGSGRRGFRTANGEIVKSKEERLIADWLFYHHVRYEYERPYEHETASETRRQYRPDFYYPDIGLYHEHFALNGEGRPPEHFNGDYLAGVAWKRQLHREKGTKLFETTSHEIWTGTAISRLEVELEGQDIDIRFDPARDAKGSQPISQKELANTLRVFQQHVKSNNLSFQQLHDAVAARSKEGDAARLAMFLSLYARISSEWERKLRDGGWIDFEDMLVLAAQHVETGRYESPYTVVLSDEFQDSSRARIRLLKALANQKDGRLHLCVVGDDWQGINRFAGADISVMNEFEQIFSHATRLTLNTTFRCPQSLCDIASAFIQANPIQIKREVATTNTFKKKSILAFGFEDLKNAQSHLEDQFTLMHHYIKAGQLKPDNGDRITVLVLGRYRNDLPNRLKRWQNKFGDLLDISFRTVHSSKGLEADYVMLLNVVEGTRGFPSQIEDDPVLQIPMPAPDPYPMAEERRLFYVALTRARRQVRIYTALEQPSRFLVELVESGVLAIQPVDGQPLEPCPKCKSGVIRIQNGKYGEFESCSTWPRCEFKRNIANGDVAL
ncbi:helicase IV [Rhizobium ruizarguesonis]|uniref:UvrD-helicase domain-containing protein n=1 Tax=Rhizobium ruizarguesonis TaxID=2081791 RepID=UPI001036D428|nr:UvrD-helicase domain-containing protein [Rhizobium ruizarguesonis]NEK06926.1 AAA family ATPase [Rhizobium ruizarguesonis]TBD39626.1 helicase IV [Rhizobium ruizarguesonis]